MLPLIISSTTIKYLTTEYGIYTSGTSRKHILTDLKIVAYRQKLQTTNVYHHSVSIFVQSMSSSLGFQIQNAYASYIN